MHFLDFDTCAVIKSKISCIIVLLFLNLISRHFGVHLTDEGADRFEAKVNIEVQYASEQAIAAVERNGGVIKTAYFNLESVIALSNPLNWFSQGKAVPKRLHPPAGNIKDCF